LEEFGDEYEEMSNMQQYIKNGFKNKKEYNDDSSDDESRGKEYATDIKSKFKYWE